MFENIVSNAGPLITLEKLVDGFAWMRQLYRRILIPTEVLAEVSHQIGSPQVYLQMYRIEDFVQVYPVKSIAVIPGMHTLDVGEIMAISLALELRCELLIEEMRGRKIAVDGGINVSGIAGQIGRACRLGILTQADALSQLQRLLATGRINRNVYHVITQHLIADN